MSHLVSSRFTHLFEKNNCTALFHSAKLNKVYTNTKLLNILLKKTQKPVEEKILKNNFPPKLVDQLTEKSFLVEPGEDEKFIVEIRRKVGSFSIRNLVLLVSNDCNFDCSYCQIEKNMPKERKVSMDIDTAQKALQLFNRNCNMNEQKTITITGGEPLLNLKVVKFIIKTVRKSFQNVRIVVFTNGSLVTEELAMFFKQNDILILVSIDGPQEMHDSARRNKSGKGSFEMAIKGYNRLQESGCIVGISAVGGTHNTYNIDATFNFFMELHPPSIGFNFSHFLIKKKNPTELSITKFGDILLYFYRILREKGIFLENISRPIGAFSLNKIRLRECQAQGQGVTVDARGKVGPCKSLTVSDDFSIDINQINSIPNNSMFKEWAKRSPVMDNYCLNCAALGICGGGCAYDSFISNKGAFQKIDRRVCSYHYNILNFLIWDLYYRSADINSSTESLWFPNLKEQSQSFFSFFDKKNQLQRSVGHE